MSSTIALKCKLDLKRSVDSKRSLITSPFRSVSIGSEAELRIPKTSFKLSTENEAANLLLSMSNIVSEEIKTNAFVFDDEDFDSGRSTSSTSSHDEIFLTPRTSLTKDYDDNLFVWNRVRTVSVDSPNASRDLAVVSPTNTPKVRSPKIRKQKRQTPKAKRGLARMPNLPKLSQTEIKGEEKSKGLEAAIRASIAKGKTMKKILRKKFSWKNYPELEAFLIANREEYLRHSALNYTVQQKQYNNSLTERLLELAAEHGYIFDEKEFSFVTVRDRIRCYFKSYVQSAKKRGIIIGYAARKAGLLSDADLERSAEQKGQIFTP